jgi:acyl-CoA thioesterase I
VQKSRPRTAHQSGKSVSRGGGGVPRPTVIAAAGLLLVILIWAIWPSPLSRVANLDSRGSTIVTFGDSLTSGVGAPAGQDYPSQLSALAGVNIINAGISGDTTESALARLDDDVLPNNPRIVIVGLGGNDFLRRVPIETTEANLRETVRRIRDAGAMVVLLGFRFPTLGARYETMYERVAREERCLLIPDLLDGILSNPSLRSDDIHPNARGYQLMAERISGPLRKLIRKAEGAGR